MQFDWRPIWPNAIRVVAGCLIQLFLIQGTHAFAQFDGGGFGGGSSGGSEGEMCAPECWCSGMDCPVLPFGMCQGCGQDQTDHGEPPGDTYENDSLDHSGGQGGNSEGASLACMNGNPCNLAYVQALLVCLGELDVLPSLPPGFPAPPPGIEDPLRVLRRVITPGVKQVIDAMACTACAGAIDQAFSLGCQEPLVEGPWELGGGVAELCLENSVSGGSSTYLSWLWGAYENQLNCASQGAP